MAQELEDLDEIRLALEIHVEGNSLGKTIVGVEMITIPHKKL